MRTSTVVVTTLAVLGLALAGCDPDPDPEPTPSPTPAPTPGPATPPPADAVASCLVGDWRSTDVDGEVGGVALSGGAGVALSIGSAGETTLDFAGMDPVAFTGEVAGADVVGEVSYAGQASGTIGTDTDADSGSWEPLESDWSDVRITVDLTEPVDARPLDDTPIGDRFEDADQWTGDVIEIEPILAEGTYQCQDGTLVLSSTGDDTISWTFTRA